MLPALGCKTLLVPEAVGDNIMLPSFIRYLSGEVLVGLTTLRNPCTAFDGCTRVFELSQTQATRILASSKLEHANKSTDKRQTLNRFSNTNA